MAMGVGEMVSAISRARTRGGALGEGDVRVDGARALGLCLGFARASREVVFGGRRRAVVRERERVCERVD